MPLYEFECPLGHRTEAIRSMDTDHIECVCGFKAKRIISKSYRIYDYVLADECHNIKGYPDTFVKVI